MGILAYFKRKLYKRRKKRLALTFPLYCKAHGVKTPERQGALAQSDAGDRLQLVHSPLPEVPHNVYIYNVELNRVIGYLHKTVAEKLVALFGKGFCRDGEIEQVTGGGEYKYRGCNLKVFESMEMLKEQWKDVRYLKE